MEDITLAHTLKYSHKAAF